jgi:hypothetical protein
MLEEQIKCHFLQIELNNDFSACFSNRLKCHFIAVSVEQLIYLLLTRCWPLPILPITLSRHLDLSPCQTWKTKLFSEGRWGDLGLRAWLFRWISLVSFLAFHFLCLTLRGRDRHRLADAAREVGAASSGRYAWEVWDWQWNRRVRAWPRLFQQFGVWVCHRVPRAHFKCSI